MALVLAIVGAAVLIGAVVGVAIRTAAQSEADAWKDTLRPTLRSLQKIKGVSEVGVIPGLIDPITAYPLKVGLKVRMSSSCTNASLGDTASFVQAVIDQQSVIDLTATVSCRREMIPLTQTPPAAHDPDSLG